MYPFLEFLKSSFELLCGTILSCFPCINRVGQVTLLIRSKLLNLYLTKKLKNPKALLTTFFKVAKAETKINPATYLE